MRAFAKAFYESPAWRSTRAYIIKRDAGLCVRCGALGAIVHHKRPLTPDNIDDPLVSLNEENLETLCRACHAIAHGAAPPIAGVSLPPVMVTAVIVSSAMVTVATTSPPKPWAEAV